MIGVIMKELLIPVGSMDALRVAVHAGADAVYLGGKRFGARAFAQNFSDEEMIEAIKYAHLYGVKVNVTVNTLIYESEFKDALDYLRFLYENGVDAVIIQDIGLICEAHKYLPDLEIHASTQVHNSNKDEIKFLEELGVKRVVMAREMSLEEINAIDTPLEKEAFIHGSLCISYSGECLFSSVLFGRSGNRGECAQVCRLPYRLMKNDKYLTENRYLISTKDLNTANYFKDILDSSIYSLKIEGRMKSPEYVGCVTRLYRDLLDKYYSHEDLVVNEEYLNDLKVIFNRKYTKGFILNENNADIVNTDTSNHLGVSLGRVIKWNRKYIYVELSRELHQGDGIRFNEINKGMIANFIYDERENLISGASKGSIILLDNKFDIDSHLTLNTTVDVKVKSKYTEIDTKKIPITMQFVAHVGDKCKLVVSDSINSIQLFGVNVEAARTSPMDKDEIVNKLSKVGGSPFKIKNINLDVDNNVFINIKDLNELRRECIDKLIEIRENVNKDRVINTNYKDEKIIYNKSNENSIAVLVRNEEQLSVALEKKVDRIYVTDKSLYLKYKNNDNIYFRTSRVNDDTNDIKNVLNTELGSLYRLRGIGDYYLNVTNHATIDYLSQYSKLLTLSIELDDSNLKELMEHYNFKVNVEEVVYLKPELMIMKYQPVLDFDDKYYLADRYDKKYEIIEDKDKNLTHIMGSDPINRLDKVSFYKGLGINNYRIEFLDEKADECGRIIDDLRRELNV